MSSLDVSILVYCMCIVYSFTCMFFTFFMSLFVSPHRELAVLFVRPIPRCLYVLCVLWYAVSSSDGSVCASHCPMCSSRCPMCSCAVSSRLPMLCTVKTMATVALAAGTPVPLVPYLASASSLAGYTTPTLSSPQSTTPGFPVGAAHNYLYQKQRDGERLHN